MQNQNSVPATAPPNTIKVAVTPTITKVFPVGAFSFVASCTPPLSVAVLFPGSVVVEVFFVKSLGRVVVTLPVVDSEVLVDKFVK